MILLICLDIRCTAKLTQHNINLPPSVLLSNATSEIGKVLHECESELVCKLSQADTKIPYFNAGIYLENKKKIGKVDEIFGPINLVMFTIKMDPGIVAKSFQEEDLVYISPDKLLPLSRFTGGGGGGGGGRGRGGGRGKSLVLLSQRCCTIPEKLTYSHLFYLGGGRGGRSPGGRGGRGGRSPGRGFGGRSPGRGFGGVSRCCSPKTLYAFLAHLLTSNITCCFLYYREEVDAGEVASRFVVCKRIA